MSKKIRVGRSENLFYSTNFHLKKLGLNVSLGYISLKLIGKPLIMRFSTSGKKIGYKCIDFPMLDNIISIYGIKTG